MIGYKFYTATVAVICGGLGMGFGCGADPEPDAEELGTTKQGLGGSGTCGTATQGQPCTRGQGYCCAAADSCEQCFLDAHCTGAKPVCIGAGLPCDGAAPSQFCGCTVTGTSQAAHEEHCGAGKGCYFGTGIGSACVDAECWVDGDCTRGQVCGPPNSEVAFRCVDCVDNDDCDFGQLCGPSGSANAFACVAMGDDHCGFYGNDCNPPSPSFECTSDADCDDVDDYTVCVEHDGEFACRGLCNIWGSPYMPCTECDGVPGGCTGSDCGADGRRYIGCGSVGTGSCLKIDDHSLGYYTLDTNNEPEVCWGVRFPLPPVSCGAGQGNCNQPGYTGNCVGGTCEMSELPQLVDGAASSDVGCEDNLQCAEYVCRDLSEPLGLGCEDINGYAGWCCESPASDYLDQACQEYCQ